MKVGIEKFLAVTTATASLVIFCSGNYQANAFSPLRTSSSPLSRRIDGSKRSIVEKGAGVLLDEGLFLRKNKNGIESRKIQREWTYIEDDGTEYHGKGKFEVKVFLPETGKVKGCALFMHGFSQNTLAYQDTLKKVADHANIAIVSPETGILSPIVLKDILSNPLAMISDKNRAQFVLQRALSEDAKQCIRMISEGHDLFQKELNIGKNVPLGVSGHSMGGGLSFPVSADFPKIDYVFTMAPVAGVSQFDPIVEGVDKRTVKNSMLLAGTWDLIAKADKVKAIAEESNERKNDSSLFVEIDRGLHTGFEDELVLTKVPLDRVLGLVFGLGSLVDKALIDAFSFLRTNTGQLEGSEVLMMFFFEKMTKGQKVTVNAADKFLEENIKRKWDKKFNISN